MLRAGSLRPPDIGVRCRHARLARAQRTARFWPGYFSQGLRASRKGGVGGSGPAQCFRSCRVADRPVGLLSSPAGGNESRGAVGRWWCRLRLMVGPWLGRVPLCIDSSTPLLVVRVACVAHGGCFPAFRVYSASPEDLGSPAYMYLCKIIFVCSVSAGRFYRNGKNQS